MMPAERSLNYLREQGIPCDKSEKWINNPKHPAGGVRRDLFLFIDIVALFPEQIVGVQCFSTQVQEHIRKIQEIPESVTWMKSGGGIHLHGWTKRKKPIERRFWQCRWLVASLTTENTIQFDEMGVI